MSVNVYLKDEVEKLEGFTTKQKEAKYEKWEEHWLAGIRLEHNYGRWYFTLYDLNDRIPEVVANIVEEISFHTFVPLQPLRERGIYSHESCEAEVGVDSEGQKLWMRIRGKKMEDVRALYRKIRAGSIRPKESHEGQQGGLSRVELEAKVTELETALQALQQADA